MIPIEEVREGMYIVAYIGTDPDYKHLAGEEMRLLIEKDADGGFRADGRIPGNMTPLNADFPLKDFKLNYPDWIFLRRDEEGSE